LSVSRTSSSNSFPVLTSLM
jgi:hypothetical protein